MARETPEARRPLEPRFGRRGRAVPRVDGQWYEHVGTGKTGACANGHLALLLPGVLMSTLCMQFCSLYFAGGLSSRQ
jgi:hypothetical protein